MLTKPSACSATACTAATPGVAATTTTGCQLTTAWGFNASFEHYWTPAVHESLFGAYYAVNYNQGTGSANAMLCTMEGNSTGGVGSTAVAGAGCNNNWSMYAIGSRLQWDVTKSFYLGIEGIYDHMNSASVNTTGVIPAGSPLAFGSATTSSRMPTCGRSASVCTRTSCPDPLIEA